MIEANIKELVALIAGLVSIKKQIEDDAAERLKAGGEPKEVRAEIAAEHGAGLLGWMGHTERVCSKYGIDITYWTKQVPDFVHEPDRYKTTLSECIDRVKHGIYEKLEQRKFMYMPAAEAELYNKPKLFGPKVYRNFRSTKKDVLEAGNCYATGRYTACVFHAMRVAEKGLHALVHHLNITFSLNISFPPKQLDEVNWGIIIPKVKKEIDILIDPNRQPQLPKADAKFYSTLASEFRYLQKAYRDDTVHSRAWFDDPGEVKLILDHVGNFMQHLALKLKE